MHSVPKKVVLIGASTGGPSQIEKIVKSLPRFEDTSFVIAQHMVDGFIPSFAQRLQYEHINTIRVIEDNDTLNRASIYLCTGYTSVEKRNGTLVFKHMPSPLNGYNPDINVLFSSFLPFIKDIKILCAILTGIGEDGVSASRDLNMAGVRCITENHDSAIVDGMPSRARSLVPNVEVYSMEEIINTICEFCE